MIVLRAVSLLLVLGGVLPGPGRAIASDPLPPRLQSALEAYLRDPVGNADALIAATRGEGDSLHPVHALLLGDAALRTGRYRMATEFFGSILQSDTDPRLAGAAEVGLAWTMLGRGRLDDASRHFAAAGALAPELRPTTDVATAMVGAARGDSDAIAALATMAGRADLDPALREVAPLLEAYARLWSGDAAGAAEAFLAFAAANPDSRFTDDALFASAQARWRTGAHDALDDLAALAGDEASKGRLSSRLRSLDGRALLREGLRRDREEGTRLLGERLADLLDGDGSRLARAVLAAHARTQAAGDAAAEAGVATAAGTLGGKEVRPGLAGDARSRGTATAASGAGTSPGGPGARRATDPERDAAAGQHGIGTRARDDPGSGPWRRMRLPLVAALLAAVLVLARRWGGRSRS